MAIDSNQKYSGIAAQIAVTIAVGLIAVMFGLAIRANYVKSQYEETSTTFVGGLSCTLVGQCLGFGPEFCTWEGQIINACGACGCPAQTICQADGTCKATSSASSASDTKINNNSVSCGYLDTNNNSKLDANDIAVFTEVWGRTCSDTPSQGISCGPKDINQNGKIDLVDLANLVSRWGYPSCN